ncbi:MAG: YfhO family protein [Anaerolineae bacterium]|nr:YfhO family protein [Anaerolineae bacterium]
MSDPTPTGIPPTRRRFTGPDTLAVLALVLLWLLASWRILTPNEQDALSLAEGDFSGQFVAFFGYQVERLSAGEVPLWNPYNVAGHPFLADTQSAVFYPPRLLSVALVSMGGDPAPGELYTALQTEMALHVLLGTLLMYAFVRRLAAPPGSGSTRPAVFGGLVAAITFGYGGYLSGYPQLQLAVLEAGIWLPLVLLGLLEATRTPRPGWRCIVLAGVAMGLSLLAGHPQTGLFTLYLALAFLVYRLRGHDLRDWRTWGRRFVWAAILFGLAAGGLAAVQLLPGLEYLGHTTRDTMGFDAKANGFPYMDIAQMLFPGFITVWSPLYIGLPGLALVIWALWRGAPHRVFFGGAAAVGLALSFGAGTVLYDIAYLIAPGMSWFRGQERAAFLVAHSLSILAGLGMAHLLRAEIEPGAVQQFRRLLIGLTALCAGFAAILFVLWRTPDGPTYAAALESATLAALIAGLTAAALPWLLRQPHSPGRALAVVALIAFDLLSVTLSVGNLEPVPADERLPEPAMIRQLRETMLPPGARVDGLRGLRDNLGTLYAVPDIRGISPLKLDSIEHILDLPDDRTWDLLAVRYVLSDWEQLMAPSTIVDTAEDPFGPYNVHALDDPRGFAHLFTEVVLVGSDDEAYGLLSDPGYSSRQAVILDADPGLDLPAEPPDDPGHAEVTRFEPEAITIQAESTGPAALAIALPDYPGWQMTVNGEDADILRAYGGLSAAALPAAGTYTVELHYHPWTVRVGAWISGITLALLLVVALAGFWLSRRAQLEA